MLFATLLSVSVCLSACTRNSVVAFVLSVAACFILLLTGFAIVQDFFAQWSSKWVIESLASMSAMTHFNGLTRGVFDARDVLYPISVVFALLWVNVLLLDWRGSK
jgi:ABC-2 type transport system permease protein